MDLAKPAEVMQTWDAVLTDMQTAVVELRAVLDAEREALDRADALALDAATSAKAELLARLESLDAERRQLDDLAVPTGESAIWRNICRQLEACRYVNEINGRIVAHRLLEVRRALGVLRGAGEAPPALYGPRGRVHARTPPRPLSSA